MSDQSTNTDGGRVLYAVTATLPDEAVAREYIAWLRDGHVRAVIAGGASSAAIVRLDADPSAGVGVRVETRYEFATRAALDRYLREVAPALRSEGVAKFPASRGVTMERRVGEVVGSWGAWGRC